MKIRIPQAVLDEMDAALEDCQRSPEGPHDPTDPTYLKILAALETANRNGAKIDANEDDIAELRSRADYVLTCIIPDNLEWASDPYDRKVYYRMKQGYTALVKQLPPKQPTKAKESK